MPRRDKCDICRLRKCDAARPACQTCIRGGRPCTYSASSESPERDEASLSGLQLTSTRRASSGEGAFHVLTLRRTALPCRAITIAQPPSPSRSLTSRADRLASRWTYMLEYDTHDESAMAGFTETFRMIPAWIGSDVVLDAAAKYTVDCHQAFMKQDETALNSAKKSGAEAMRALRCALAESTTDATDSMLVSMYAMIMSEYMGGIDSYNYKLHELALCQILKQRWTSGRWGLLEQRLLRSVHSEEALESAISGKISSLDEPLRIATARAITTSDTSTNALFDSIMDQTIQLPRLSALHRQLLLGQHSSNDDLLAQTTDLALTLWTFPQAPEIDDLVTSHMSSDSEIDETCPLPALSFTSIRVYILSNRHHMNRIILTINLLKLLALIPELHNTFNCEEVRASLVSSAEFVSRCIPYALRSSSGTGPPWNALRIFAPLSLAYGAWVFLEREGGSAGDEAARMRAYTGWGFQQMADSWRWNVSLETLLGYCEAWTGGETMQWMVRGSG